MKKTSKTSKTPKTPKAQVAGRLVVLAVLGVLGAAAMTMHQQLFLLCARKQAPAPALPYDAEVEWLESAGDGSNAGQYINTGVLIPRDCDVVEYRFKFLFVRNQKGVLFGHQTASYGNPRTYAFYSSGASNNRQFYAGDYLSFAAIPLDAGTVFEGSLVIDEAAGKLSLYEGDTRVRYNNLVGTALNHDFPIFVFAGCYGTALDDCASVRMMYFTILHGGTVVRDFVPVRVGSGSSAVGYMYDRVSGTLLGNQGTGAFVIGPDK